MPYIKQEDRDRVNQTGVATTRGELNYLISKTLNDYVKQHGLSYTVCDEVVEVINALINSFKNSTDSQFRAFVSNDNQKALVREIAQYISNLNTEFIKYETLFGVLDCVKMEFYRRVAGPYEDQKIIENGDVYEF